MRPVIEQNAIAWAVGIVTPEEIDEINILNASFLAMHRALDALSTRPEALLIDGNRFAPYHNIPYSCEIKGDGRFLSIAAASILAKTYRDDYMTKLHEEFPQYHWNDNKGYPTAHTGLPLHNTALRLIIARHSTCWAQSSTRSSNDTIHKNARFPNKKANLSWLAFLF